MSSQPELSREENHLTSDTQKSVELSVKGKGLKPDIYTQIGYEHFSAPPQNQEVDFMNYL